MSQVNNSSKKRIWDMLEDIGIVTEAHRRKRQKIDANEPVTPTKCPHDNPRNPYEIHCDQLSVCALCEKECGCEECNWEYGKKCAGCDQFFCTTCAEDDPYIECNSCDLWYCWDCHNDESIVYKHGCKVCRPIKDSKSAANHNVKSNRNQNSKPTQCPMDNGRNPYTEHCDELAFCDECCEECGCDGCKYDHGFNCAACGMFRCFKYCIGSHNLLGANWCESCDEMYCNPCTDFKMRGGKLRCGSCRKSKSYKKPY